MENFFDDINVDSTEVIDRDNIIFVFGDVETTGFNEQKERMTEIALVKSDGHFNIIDTFESLINPEVPISAKITEITGITEEMVADQPVYSEIYPKIKKFMYENNDGKKVIFVAHNAPFDNRFINYGANMILEEELITDFIDTVSIARELYPYWKNHKLDTCAEKFNIENENHHRALNDTMVLYHIGKRLIEEALADGLNPINFITKKKLHYGKSE